MKEDLEKVFSVDKLCPVSRTGGKHNQINSLLEIYACIDFHLLHCSNGNRLD